MMLRRTFWPILTATVLATALGSGLERAEGAIRVTISDTLNTKVFYSPSSQVAVINSDIGDYDFVLQTTISNFPGLTTGGRLTQTLNLSSSAPLPGGSVLPTLSVRAEIIQAVGALGAGQVTGADLGNVNAAPLLRFTQPDTLKLNVTSSISSPQPNAPGTMTNGTTVNGVLVSTDPTPIGSNTTKVSEVTNTPLGYTLTSEVVVSGLNAGISNLSISSLSTATALSPEPSSLAIWGLGGLGFVLMATRRRLLHSTATG